MKALDRAKTRLSRAPQRAERRALALAFAVDTVRAALACERVARVVVVSDDAEVRDAVSASAPTGCADIEAAGLNEVVRAVAARLRVEDPQIAVAALVADLPALRPDELRRRPARGRRRDRGFVADAAGTGTTLLTARAGSVLDPRFGPRSRAAHAASGAVALEAGPIPGLRRDVDTEVDLWDAGRLGVGATTAALVHGALTRRSPATRATVRDHDPEARSGTALLDDGTTVAYDAAAFEAGGLLLLRTGQVRVHLRTAGAVRSSASPCPVDAEGLDARRGPGSSRTRPSRG